MKYLAVILGLPGFILIALGYAWLFIFTTPWLPDEPVNRYEALD